MFETLRSIVNRVGEGVRCITAGISRIAVGISRLSVVKSFREARKIAGPSGGTFFALKDIFQVPLENFLWGYGASIVTASISTISMGYYMYENYQESDPDHIGHVIKENETRLTTSMIIEKLKQDEIKAIDFLRQHHISANDIIRFQHGNVEMEKGLYDTLKQLYADIQIDYDKYPVSLLYAITMAGSHFIEVMLVQVYVDMDMFDYGLQPTAANVLLTSIMLLALYNGIQKFLDVKNAYENPSAVKLCDVLFKAYDRHVVSQMMRYEDELASDENSLALVSSL